MNPYECQRSSLFSDLWLKVSRIVCPSKFQTSSQKQQGRFKSDFICLIGTKVYIIGPDLMTKIAALPIYGKNH